MFVKIFSVLYENRFACEINIPPLKIVAPAADATTRKSETNLHHKPSNF